jgi:CubicO group peptidase (beta-lactamase class C family)
MTFNQKLMCFVFGCTFVILGQMVSVDRLDADSESESAFYQGIQCLHTNEFMKTWLMLGPIPVFQGDPNPQDQEAQKKAFASDFLTQHGGETAIQPKPSLTHQLGDKEYQWQLVQAKDDIIDLVEIYGEKGFAVAYAWAEIDMPHVATMLLGIGSDDAIKVWLNGKLVHEKWIGRPLQKDDDLIPIKLQEGKNQLLLKVQNQQYDWEFVCRVVRAEILGGKLVSAAGRGDLEAIDQLLSYGVDINAKDEYGLTALQYAKIQGHKDIVDFLLSKGADPNLEMSSEEQIIDAIFKAMIKGDSSGAAVLVAKDGKVLFKKGYGYANLEHHVPVTPETKFRIGSITKQFTAAAILQLQEQGKLSVTDSLSKFIPDFPRGDEVKLHHLLTHTSGIHSYTEKLDFWDKVTVYTKPAELIELFKNDPFDFSPGEKWHYSNSGYFLLGYIVEKVSGESYADYLKNHIFKPLGMNNTGVHHWSDILEHEASGYSYENKKFKKALNWDMSRAGGAGALYSTVEDLYLWNEAIFNGKLLDETSLKAAFTPVTINKDEKSSDSLLGVLGDGYGYGWVISTLRGLRVMDHGGGLQGFTAHLARYPDQNFTVVILSNAVPPPPRLSPASLSRELAQSYLWKEMKARQTFTSDTTVDLSIYDSCVGRYDFMSMVITITKEGDRLFGQLTGQRKIELHPRSETEFFVKEVDVQFTFVKNEKGEVDKVIVLDRGRRIVASRLEEIKVAEVDPSIYDAYVGQYDFKMGVLTVTKEGNRLLAQMTGQPKFEIFPRSETEFFWKVVNAQITFMKNEKGEVVKAILRQAGSEFEVPKIK